MNQIINAHQIKWFKTWIQVYSPELKQILQSRWQDFENLKPDLPPLQQYYLSAKKNNHQTYMKTAGQGRHDKIPPNHILFKIPTLQKEQKGAQKRIPQTTMMMMMISSLTEHACIMCVTDRYQRGKTSHNISLEFLPLIKNRLSLVRWMAQGWIHTS